MSKKYSQIANVNDLVDFGDFGELLQQSGIQISSIDPSNQEAPSAASQIIGQASEPANSASVLADDLQVLSLGAPQPTISSLSLNHASLIQNHSRRDFRVGIPQSPAKQRKGLAQQS